MARIVRFGQLLAATENPVDAPGAIIEHDGNIYKYCQVVASAGQDEIKYGEWGLIDLSSLSYGVYKSPYIVSNLFANNKPYVVAGICIAENGCPNSHWAYFMLRGWFKNALVSSANYTKGATLILVNRQVESENVGNCLATAAGNETFETARYVATAAESKNNATSLNVLIHATLIV